MRYLPILVALAVPAVASAQSDSVPSPAPAPAAADTTGDFRPGQWGARFIANGGFYGGGALYFTAPRTAWLIEASVNASYEEQGDFNYNNESIVVIAGKRWYGERHRRVRSIGGAGVLAGFGRNYYSGTDDANEGYSAGVYGELGAAVFFTPHLSLGAGARAYLSATFFDLDSNETDYNFSAGPMFIEGAFYF